MTDPQDRPRAVVLPPTHADPTVLPPSAALRTAMSDQHRRYVRWIIGIAADHGIDLTQDAALQDTARCALHLPDCGDLTIIIPPPPEGWNP